MYKLSDKETEILEILEWRVIEVGEQGGDEYVEIESWSPAGEDLPTTVWIEPGRSFADAVRKVAEDFDIDEHIDTLAECRGLNGVPSTYRELVDDAEAIAEMYQELANALAEAEEEERGAPKDEGDG